MPKKTRKRRKPKVETKDGARRQAQRETHIRLSKRGTRTDYTRLRVGSKTEDGGVVRRCTECGRPARVRQRHNSALWGTLVFYLHREITKDGQSRITDFCLN